ncbi:site-specific integrase [Aequorivita vladivostokensis]|uniref:Tyr recombinase domain-containing protein n=1 Tax=Aequorivita vladivostokensis TaxID=171194 RepID=A0ABR5DMA3_9FLAO|nr:site-specific integrase [Aequorivita vladivostokensis]KJJ39888.1 hypothetical protein MB09_01580 [Aequorivita vladivostokensis]
MSTVTAILRKKKNSQGLFPLAIRVTKNRKSSYIYTGFNIAENQWDDQKRIVKKNHPNSRRLNNLLLSKMAKISDTVLEVESDSKSTSVSYIKQRIQKGGDTNFFDLAQKHIQTLIRRNQHHQAKTEEGRIKVLKEFSKTTTLPFENITESFLYRFKSYLLGDKKLSERTVVNYLILIRTTFNIAIRDEVIDRDIYPFGRGKVTIRIPESDKVGLNKDEIIKLESLNLESLAKKHALNVWLFSFYLAGIRVGDVLRLKWGDITDGRLNYRMSKNKKLVSLKMPEKALQILDGYKTSDIKKNDFIFPELKKAKLNDSKDVTRKIQTATRKFNRHLSKVATLAKIDKSISMHIARHSFGYISGAKIPIQMLQKLYRHSSITTTVNYQSNFIHNEEDEALDVVLKF